MNVSSPIDITHEKFPLSRYGNMYGGNVKTSLIDEKISNHNFLMGIDVMFPMVMEGSKSKVEFSFPTNSLVNNDCVETSQSFNIPRIFV